MRHGGTQTAHKWHTVCSSVGRKGNDMKCKLQIIWDDQAGNDGWYVRIESDSPSAGFHMDHVCAQGFEDRTVPDEDLIEEAILSAALYGYEPAGDVEVIR